MDIQNPVPITNIGDPYVLNYKGVYYLYATSMSDGYYCWKSNNLSDWSAPWVCYKATERSFGNSCFWAPEVYEFGGKSMKRSSCGSAWRFRIRRKAHSRTC